MRRESSHPAVFDNDKGRVYDIYWTLSSVMLLLHLQLTSARAAPEAQ